MGHGALTPACDHVAGMGGGAAAPVMSEGGARLPMTSGSSFSDCGVTEGEGWAPTLSLARDRAASSSSSFQASAPWEGSTVEMQASSSH